MRTATVSIVLALTASFVAAAEPLRVLFVGNSYTGVNDLPSLVRALAAADRGARPVAIARALQGGAQLQWHWTGKGRGGKPMRSDVRAVIDKGNFDFVVIQEQSQMSAILPAVTLKYARLLCQAVRKRGAMPVMYMTWARKGVMKDPRGGSHPAWTPERMQAAIAATYTRAGKEGRALVAPVGLAWAAVRKARPKLALHARDGSHPSIHGSYLAACVFHAVLTGRTPVGLPVRLTVKAGSRARTLADIPPADARFLQETAQQTVKAFRAKHPDPEPAGSTPGNAANAQAGPIAPGSSTR